MMKRILFLIIPILFVTTATAQNFNMQAGTFNYDCTSNGTLFDSGGAGGNYGNNQNIVMEICPSGTGDPIALSFVSATFGANDDLCIYDGSTNPADLLYCFNDDNSLPVGTNIRTTVTNASGCLFVQFISDGSGTGNFEFDIICLPPCQSVTADTVSLDPSI
ncbi:MAG: hypothetical protein ACPG4Z_08570, partial [Chitinophagales bacterium]